MDFDAVLLPGRRAASIADGLWHDRTIDDALRACVSSHPDRMAVMAYEVDSGAEHRFTYGELGELVDRFATGLHGLGVRAGDVVAVKGSHSSQMELVVNALLALDGKTTPRAANGT